MNYAQPRQLADTGKWRWTVRNDDQIFPVGYCSPNSPNYCTGGHDTAEEAREHMRQYMLNERTFLDAGDLDRTQVKCVVHDCDNWTSKATRVGSYTTFMLCDEHRNMGIVNALYYQSDSIYS